MYVDFKNNATESLSQIILDDFYTDNTIGMEEHFTVSQKGAVYSQKRVKETLTFSDFFGLPAVEHEDSMVTLENVETVNEFASLFRKDYDKMKGMDIQTYIRNYLMSGEFNHEAYHLVRSTSRIARRKQSAGSKQWELRAMSAKRSCEQEEKRLLHNRIGSGFCAALY